MSVQRFSVEIDGVTYRLTRLDDADYLVLHRQSIAIADDYSFYLDLKNPLAAIGGLAEIMLETKKIDSATPAEDIEMLESIHDAARHMSEVVAGIRTVRAFGQEAAE